MLPLAEKYRPRVLDEVRGQRHAVAPLKRYVAARNLPHLLLHGPAGTGKTSSVQCAVREIYGEHSHVLELNASDDRGIDCVRNKIKEYAGCRRMFAEPGSMQVVVLDEVDSMTLPAMMALRKIIERTSDNARFVLICNQVNRLIPALQSRCMRFRYAPLDADDVQRQLAKVCAAEGRDLPPEVLRGVALSSEGDLRRAMNSLQTVFNMEGAVTPESVSAVVGVPMEEHVRRVLEASASAPSTAAALERVRALMADHGIALQSMLPEVYAAALRAEGGRDLPSLVRTLAHVERCVIKGGGEEVLLHLLVHGLRAFL